MNKNFCKYCFYREVPTFKDRDIDRDWSNGTGINSKITIKMESLPMEQYIRKLVRSPLELIGLYTFHLMVFSWVLFLAKTPT